MCFPETAGHLRTGHARGQGGAGGGEGEVPAEDALCGCYRQRLSPHPLVSFLKARPRWRSYTQHRLWCEFKTGWGEKKIDGSSDFGIRLGVELPPLS